MSACGSDYVYTFFHISSAPFCHGRAICTHNVRMHLLFFITLSNYRFDDRLSLLLRDVVFPPIVVHARLFRLWWHNRLCVSRRSGLCFLASRGFNAAPTPCRID